MIRISLALGLLIFVAGIQPAAAQQLGSGSRASQSFEQTYIGSSAIHADNSTKFGSANSSVIYEGMNWRGSGVGNHHTGYQHAFGHGDGRLCHPRGLWDDFCSSCRTGMHKLKSRCGCAKCRHHGMRTKLHRLHHPNCGCSSADGTGSVDGEIIYETQPEEASPPMPPAEEKSARRSIFPDFGSYWTTQKGV